MPSYSITDLTTSSAIVLSEDTTALTFWGLPKTAAYEVRDGYLYLYLGKKLILPKIPRAYISSPVSTSDEDLFTQLSFLSQQTSGGGGSVSITFNAPLEATPNPVTGTASVGLSVGILGKTLYVSTTGDNGTGQKGNILRPWRNPTTAIAAAAAGDTVMVLDGVHSIGPGADVEDDGAQFIVKSDVLVYLADGVTVHYKETGGGGTNPFDDLTKPSNFVLIGAGRIISDKTRGLAGGLNINMLTNAASSIKIVCKSLDFASRLFCSDFQAIEITATEYWKTQKQFFAFRPNVVLSGRSVKIKTAHLDRSEYFAINPLWAHTDIRNLSNSVIEIELGKHSISEMFNAGTGALYFQNILSSLIRVRSGNIVEANAPIAGIPKPYFTALQLNASTLDWNLVFNGARIHTAYMDGSNTALRGDLQMSGFVPQFTSTFYSAYIGGVGAGRLKTRLNIEINMDSSLPIVSAHGSPSGYTISGSLKTGSATTPPLGPVNNAALPLTFATLRELNVQTAFSNCFDNTAAAPLTVPTVNVQNVWANVAPNLARIVEALQVINVDAAVTA